MNVSNIERTTYWDIKYVAMVGDTEGCSNNYFSTQYGEASPCMQEKPTQWRRNRSGRSGFGRYTF